MQKLAILINLLKGLIVLLCSFYEFVEFFFQVWTWIEAIPVMIVATWILIMKLALFLNTQYKVRLPYGLPKKAGKCVLKSVFWVSVIACLLGLISKVYFGIQFKRLIVLLTVYTFLIYNDQRELQHVVRKIDEQP